MHDYASSLSQQYQSSVSQYNGCTPDLESKQTEYIEWRSRARTAEDTLKDLSKSHSTKAFWGEVVKLRKEIGGLEEQNRVLKDRVGRLG